MTRSGPRTPNRGTVPVPRQTDLICTPQRRAAMMPYATQNGGYRVERQTQCVTVGIRTRHPSAPVSRLPAASNARVRALAIDDHADQGLLIIRGAAAVERFVERRTR
jgi:hypothetical protein